MVKPIETRYKGYHFRSRLEARWAIFPDALSISWEYEKEGYDLGPIGWYLPDFWLSNEECWIEVKGKSPTEKEIARAKELIDRARSPVWLVEGLPQYDDDMESIDGGAHEYSRIKGTYLCPSKLPDFHREFFEYPDEFGGIDKLIRDHNRGFLISAGPPYDGNWAAWRVFMAKDSSLFRDAVYAARSARFEGKH